MQEEDKQAEGEAKPEEISEYTCKKCRCYIFNTSQLEPSHTSKTKRIVTRPQKKGKGYTECSSFFLEMQDWMQKSMNDESQQHGVLYCPNPKCKAKLGSYSHFGAQCSCGKFTCPAYQIPKSNVDLKAKINLSMGTVIGGVENSDDG